ncbi:DUF4291 domain-containing protein [Streptomyces clavuligerus]|uniref:DUF4291 domain-containing protein n=1 Tax=Streptomyces clavuligerus TaxID=1901 RepID=B5H0R0_STRCL|nr:DUF4291 domain-containing protein [Streptomyces clavuligerus]ANW21648.1 hypothetical protein BB341_27265 [Streptomyces clavuligerus]AXU16276.1 DUF4291 domain-containing protein [Streptomyces clavuligerus]EDY52156.1 conserved hypothetical protein [Streptomyces clavuligerus]EFG05171.1 Hypothetical protein SCLAV_0095 [Streptomyces clavuligerus]MBY6306435.1 DUF4291 domain-containing protein [Streptomyces clavuligerus]
MVALRQIRAQYDDRTIVVYQAYSSAIAEPALRAGTFVPPFSFGRMTWIKPSFLWLMHRSNWARKPGQERILAVRITREGWEEALSQAVLTTSHPDRVAQAPVHVQWDPERSLRGAALNHYSIQVGVGRGLIERYAKEWVVGITEVTSQARKAAELAQGGRAEKAKRLLPPERPYPVPRATAQRLDIDG